MPSQEPFTVTVHRDSPPRGEEGQAGFSGRFGWKRRAGPRPCERLRALLQGQSAGSATKPARTGFHQFYIGRLISLAKERPPTTVCPLGAMVRQARDDQPSHAGNLQNLLQNLNIGASPRKFPGNWEIGVPLLAARQAVRRGDNPGTASAKPWHTGPVWPRQSVALHASSQVGWATPATLCFRPRAVVLHGPTWSNLAARNGWAMPTLLGRRR